MKSLPFLLLLLFPTCYSIKIEELKIEYLFTLPYGERCIRPYRTQIVTVNVEWEGRKFPQAIHLGKSLGIKDYWKYFLTHEMTNNGNFSQLILKPYIIMLGCVSVRPNH